jgi:hypothetical protein
LSDELQPYHDQLREILVEGLQDPIASVRLAALVNISYFLIVARDQRSIFQPLIPNMLQVCASTLSLLATHY